MKLLYAVQFDSGVWLSSRYNTTSRFEDAHFFNNPRNAKAELNKLRKYVEQVNWMTEDHKQSLRGNASIKTYELTLKETKELQ